MSDIILKNQENKLITNEEMLKSLVESQTIMNYAFAGFKTETEQKFQEVNNKINRHEEILQKRVYITSGKARTLQEKVKEKVRTVCDYNGLDYNKYKSKIFPRVWSKIKAKYDVANYRELPEIFWQEILEYLRDMTVDINDLKNQVA